LIGCGASGVLGEGEEHETGTAVAVWAAAFGPGAGVTAFHAGSTETADMTSLPDLPHADGVILLADPWTFMPDDALSELGAVAPGVPVLGGVASARSPDGTAALFLGESVREQGAVGVALRGVDMIPCVSQGASPLGPEVTITRAEGNVILELAGRPALETLERLVSDLAPRERALLSGGLLLGIVVDSGKPEFEQGDFLVRGLAGFDRASGAIAVATAVEPGQIVRVHARDARSAHDDLNRALRALRHAASEQAAGALVFSCNGRGRSMFDAPGHDAVAVRRELGGAASAGFFAAGEFGPVAGRNFLHSFTATIAVFA
jgi:small ligand-binding sensory domain FIST